jgi:hypothetical protein
MDAAEEIGGTAPRHDPVSNLADDQGARTTQKDAAWQIMEAAYMAASSDGTLPALARQIYYQANHATDRR